MLTEDIGKFILYSDGRIWSKWKKGFLNIAPNGCGYKIMIIDNVKYYQHIMIAKAFIPNPNNFPLVNHLNGIKSDNRIENLVWATHSDNLEHAYRTGERGKITKQQAIEIKYSDPKIFHTDLAKKYNISSTAVSNIRNGKFWKNI
jgi:hypothetical protein